MVEVQKYNPQWNNRFQSISSNFMPHIKDYVEEVLHVGSTSIKGMSATPVIDIDIVVENFDQISSLSDKLRLVGYQLDPTAAQADKVQFIHNKTTAHKLLVLKKDSLLLKCHKLLKCHLENNKESFKEMSALKNKYADQKISFDKYQKIKAELIEKFLVAEGLESSELAQVKEIFQVEL